MNILITPKEQICKELTDIDSFLNITMSENAEEAVLRGNDLAVYVARSGKLLADAKYWLNEAMNSETMKTLAETAKNAKATATAINALVNSLCREERYLVDLLCMVFLLRSAALLYGQLHGFAVHKV